MPGRERLRVSYVAHVVSELYVLTTCLKRTVSVRCPRYCTGIVLTRAAHAWCPYSLARCKCVQVRWMWVCPPDIGVGVYMDDLPRFSRSPSCIKMPPVPVPPQILQVLLLQLQVAENEHDVALLALIRERERLQNAVRRRRFCRNKCVVSAEHVLTRYGPREFCLLIGQLNLGSAE